MGTINVEHHTDGEDRKEINFSYGGYSVTLALHGTKNDERPHAFVSVHQDGLEEGVWMHAERKFDKMRISICDSDGEFNVEDTTPRKIFANRNLRRALSIIGEALTI